MSTRPVAPVTPSVSVIIPMFNAEQTILRALQSIAEQETLPNEVICVDDCSTDATLEFALSFSRATSMCVRVIQQSCNQGASAARNVGLRECVGSLVAFLDADDDWYPCKLSCQLAIMEQTGADLLGGHSELRGVEPHKPSRRTLLANPVTLAEAMFANPFHTSSVIVRRNVMRPFPVGTLAEDFAAWLQLLAAGRRAYRHLEPLSCMYKRPFGDGGLSSSLWQMQRGEMRALRNVRRAAGCWMTSAAIALSLAKFVRRCTVTIFRAYKPRSGQRAV